MFSFFEKLLRSTKNPSPRLWAQILHVYQPPHWTPRVIRRVTHEAYEPLITHLEQLPNVHLTLNLPASLAEQLLELGYGSLLDRLHQLVQRGQIELLGTGAFHPLLPKLPASEIRRQIELQHECLKKIFSDYQPRGFFPPELAISSKLLKILSEFGYQYCITDDAASPVSLPLDYARTRYVDAVSGVTLVMRSRHFSDAFLDAHVTSEHTFHEAVGRGQTIPIITAIDGENLGHHRPGMDRTWKRIVSSDHFTCITAQELLHHSRGRHEMLSRACSWSSRPEELVSRIPYGLWDHPENPIHQLLWQLTHLAIQAAEHGPKEAREDLDRSLNSDHFWWASAEPWWSVELVQQGAMRLLHVIQKTSHADKQAHAKRLIHRILHLLVQWQGTGIAKKKQRAIRRYYTLQQYFGGKPV